MLAWIIGVDAAAGVYFVLLAVGVVIGVAYLAHLCLSKIQDMFDVWDE